METAGSSPKHPESVWFCTTYVQSKPVKYLYKHLTQLCWTRTFPRVDSIIVIGGGAAGLSLAYYLSRLCPTADFSCTIVDPDSKTENDRTWSYWGDVFDFDHLAEHRWSAVRMVDQHGAAEARFGNGRYGRPGYRFIPAHRFYQAVRTVIAADPRFRWIRGRAEGVRPSGAGAVVDLVTPGGRQSLACNTVVDTVFGGTKQPNDGGRSAPWVQSFVGWEIVATGAQWDPTVMTLMDFTGAHGGEPLEFFYTLPMGTQRALVEITTVDTAAPDFWDLEERLETHVNGRIGPLGWKIQRRERGSIPLFQDRRPGGGDGSGPVVALGVAAGAARPSTGYAFRSIVETSRATVEHYRRTGVLAVPTAPTDRDRAFRRRRGRFYDAVFMEVLRSEPTVLPRALTNLFRRNPPERVLRFLEGRSSLIQELGIVFSLPWGPFLRALGRLLTRVGTHSTPVVSQDQKALREVS